MQMQQNPAQPNTPFPIDTKKVYNEKERKKS